jgi:hypothetical protein
MTVEFEIAPITINMGFLLIATASPTPNTTRTELLPGAEPTPMTTVRDEVLTIVHLLVLTPTPETGTTWGLQG